MSPHVVLLGPDLFSAFDEFARALKQQGCRVSGVGATPRPRLRAGLARHLDAWIQVRSPFDGEEVARAVTRAARGRPIDRLEAVDERLVESAAVARQRLVLPGLSVESARLCRDKPAMKEALRRAGLPCAESSAVGSRAELSAFAERVGLPIVAKPRAGLGGLKTFRIETAADLERAARELGLDGGSSAAAEEWVEGHEGFYDTLSVDGEPRLEFVSHYYPNVLAALADRRVAPQIAATNRVEGPGYPELREVGRQVIRALGIGTSATHMEWFFGAKGLKVSEIGARPPGERLWDLYCVGNDLDLYAAWGEAVAHGRVSARASRRYATGSVQVRPPRDGKFAGFSRLDEVRRVCGPWIWQQELPRTGRRTVPLEKGYLSNVWFRMKHPDYDELRRLMSFAGRTLRVRVQQA